MNKTFLMTGSILSAFAVALGAFAAHRLNQIADADTVKTFQTGVQYQMYHGLALLAAGILFEKFPYKWTKWAGGCFITGIFLFSGSLYVMTALKVAGHTNLTAAGIITPFGGIFFILGWLFLVAGITKRN